MKTTRTVEIEANDLIRFLREKLNITASTGEIDCTAVLRTDGGFSGRREKLETITLTWTENSSIGDRWDR